MGIFDKLRRPKQADSNTASKKQTESKRESNEYGTLKITVETSTTLARKGGGLSLSGKHAEAIGYYDKALQLDPQNADAHMSRGGSLFLLARYAEAESSYYQALKIDPNRARALGFRGNFSDNFTATPKL